MVSRDAIIEMRNRNVCMEKEGKPWSNEDSQSLGTFYDMGFGITEMAVILQRSERAIYQQLVLMGAFQSPVKRTYLPKEQKCLCESCKLDIASCPSGEHCPKLKEAAKC